MTLFDCVLQFAGGGDVVDGVGDEIDGRDDKGDDAPGAEEQAFALKFPVFLAEAGLAHNALQAAGLPGDEHTDVVLEGDQSGLAHGAANLTLARGSSVEIGSWIGGSHEHLLEIIVPRWAE